MLHANWAEILWFTIAVLGSGATVESMIAIQSNWRATISQNKIKPLPPSQIALAKAMAISTRLQTVAQLFILISASAALFLEPPPPPYSKIPQSAIGIGCWIIVSSMITINSLYGRLARRRIYGTYYDTPQRRSTDDRPTDSGPDPAA